MAEVVDSGDSTEPSASPNPLNHLHAAHPSVMALEKRGVVEARSGEISSASQRQQEEENAMYEAKSHKNAHKNRIRGSRADFFFNRSSIGYEVLCDTKLYKDEDMKIAIDDLFKLEILGGPHPDDVDSPPSACVRVFEPFEGYVASSDVKAFDIADPRWKFRLMHSSAPTMISLPDLSPESSPQKRRGVTFADDTIFDEEKMDRIPNEVEQQSVPLERILEEQNEQLNKILRVPPANRTIRQIIDLWTYAMNLKSTQVLADSYHVDVETQFFDRPNVTGRTELIQLLPKLMEDELLCKYLTVRDTYKITENSYMIQYEVLASPMSTSSVAYRDSFAFGAIGIDSNKMITNQSVKYHPSLSSVANGFERPSSVRSNRSVRSWSTAANDDASSFYQVDLLNEANDSSWQNGLFWMLVLAMFVVVFPRWLKPKTWFEGWWW